MCAMRNGKVHLVTKENDSSRKPSTTCMFKDRTVIIGVSLVMECVLAY